MRSSDTVFTSQRNPQGKTGGKNFSKIMQQLHPVVVVAASGPHHQQDDQQLKAACRRCRNLGIVITVFGGLLLCTFWAGPWMIVNTVMSLVVGIMMVANMHTVESARKVACCSCCCGQPGLFITCRVLSILNIIWSLFCVWFGLTIAFPAAASQDSVRDTNPTVHLFIILGTLFSFGAAVCHVVAMPLLVNLELKLLKDQHAGGFPQPGIAMGSAVPQQPQEASYMQQQGNGQL